MSNDLPFICHANRKITIEDIKFVLSSHYQDTPYDPFAPGADYKTVPYRPIGINRNQELSILQLRPGIPSAYSAIQWLTFASNPFNTLTPFFTNVVNTPDCYRDTTETLDSHNAYWANRLISLIAADHYQALMQDIEDYQLKEMGYAHERIAQVDKQMAEKEASGSHVVRALGQANARTADHVMKATEDLLTKLVVKASQDLPGSFTREHY